MKREILISFVGHLVLVLALGIAGALKLTRPRPRPAVFTVRLVNPGTPAQATKPDGVSVVEKKPKPQVKPEPKPEPKKQPSVVKKHGLGARIEGADALGYAYYLNIILAKIADNWYNPYAGQSRTFRATVCFVIEKDGAVTGAKLEKGSGNRGYDASCERAVLVTEKLPPLPPEFKGQQLKLHLEFEYTP